VLERKGENGVFKGKNFRHGGAIIGNNQIRETVTNQSEGKLKGGEENLPEGFNLYRWGGDFKDRTLPGKDHKKGRRKGGKNH